MFQRILFPTDGSRASLEAADALIGLAGNRERLNVAVAVVISPLDSAQCDYRADYLAEHNAWLRRDAQRLADRAVEELRATGVICTTRILEGKPVSAVLAAEVAVGAYDLVVMSSRGLGQQDDRLRYLGSTTEHLLRRVSIPVLVVPVKSDDDD